MFIIVIFGTKCLKYIFLMFQRYLRHIERQNDFWTKENANNKFLSKIWECWTDMHLRIVKLESGSQQLPVMKKKIILFIKVRKTKVFIQITVCQIITRLHHPELKLGASTINKRKDLCIPYTTRKNNILIKKSQKIQLSDLKCAILNKYAFESRKFKGGICCCGHLAVTYGGELLYLWIFSLLSPPNNFVERELPFPLGFKSRTHTSSYWLSCGESRGNDNVRRSRWTIAPNPEVQ